MKSFVKSLLPLGQGPRPRRILSGLYRGLWLEIDPAFETQIWAGLYEMETHASLRRLAKGAHAFVDIGAGSGELSLWFAKIHPTAPVLAYEPDEACRERMKRNLFLNFPGTPPALTLSGEFIDDREGTVSLDEVARLLPAPVLIKIDTEGAEARILRSGSSILRQRKARLLIETHSLELEIESLHLLREWGYQTEVIRPAAWRRWLPEFRPPLHNQWIAATPVP
ncbi:MAG: FkbM family methyltransferase [Candidatus Methylacidiphilales bacterium]|nr:FkbM family methyltransferase [Candidatus Methylacidiphilales bacterium]